MRTLRLLPAITFSLLLTCCTAQSGNVVDVPSLRAELAKGDVQLIDVRTPQEWSTGHIEGAQHIDWFSDDFKTEVAKLDRDVSVRLYCAVGGRSEEAREMLLGMGFRDVKDLDGGMTAWKKAGAPVVK